jgi:tetratricopeptide (TPR) repeat protein
MVICFDKKCGVIDKICMFVFENLILKKYIYNLFLFSALLAQTIVYGQTGTLNEEQRLAFDRAFFKGMKEKMQGNLDEADLSFREAIILDKENANVYYQIAEINYVKKNIKEAVRFGQMAVQLNPKNVWYNNLLADLYKTNRNYEKSAELYIQMYENLKPELNYLYEAATNYFYENKYSKSIKTLDKIEKLIGPKEEVIIKKEQIYLQSNKINKAILEVERLIKLYPDVKYKGMLADLYLSKKKEQKALAIYNEILKQDSTNGYASIALSDYYGAKKNSSLAYKYLKIAIASNDMEVKYKIQILIPFVSPQASKEQHLQGYELVNIFKQANKAEAPGFMLNGDLYMQDKLYAQAREEYLSATKIDATNYMVWQQILFCDQELNDNEKLLIDCENAISLFPTEPLFYNFKSITNFQQKNYEVALNSALAGLEYVVENDELKIQFLSIAGDAAHKLKKNNLVDSIYEQALILDPKNAYALNNYAYFLSLRKEKLDKADSMSYLSLQIEPNSASYLDTYGWILFQKKEFQKAKNYIEQSLTISPNSGEVLEHYGDILYQLGEKTEAIKYWNKALENNSSGEFLNEKIKQGKLLE